MAYINLIDKIPVEDIVRIENFIYRFGIHPDRYVGTREWLSNWEHANQKLYKLLGGKLIHEIDFTYDKDEDKIYREIREMLDRKGHYSDFRDTYGNFFMFIKEKLSDPEWGITREHIDFFNHFTDYLNFYENSLHYGLKYKKPGAKKTLQIPEKTKPMRAIQKIVDYFKDYFHFDTEAIERLRIRYSMIFNDRKVKGKLCFSIHPLDYMTMSDNDSNWSSCMSWADQGCYHAGTVEMMNSNNVICCYLTIGNEEYYFNKNKDIYDPNFTWNNKRWRVLAYITKDIIMSGKAYPYRNDNFSQIVIDEIKNLAKKNLNWDYSFGPELYRDMKYIHSEYPFDRVREWRAKNKLTKHSIFWDTNAMYNDMLNDHSTNYWCYRNKVEHTKIIKVSGKCNCLACNAEVPQLVDYTGGEYNERYDFASSTICGGCLMTYRCNICGSHSTVSPLYEINVDGHIKKVCSECLSGAFKVCPDCGKIMYIEYPIRAPRFMTDELFTTQKVCWEDWTYYDYYYLSEDNIKKEIEKKIAFICKDCFLTKHIQNAMIIGPCTAEPRVRFRDSIANYEAPIIIKGYDAKYQFKNLRKADITSENLPGSVSSYADFNFCIAEIKKWKSQQKK